jgi:hypothetical protein
MKPLIYIHGSKKSMVVDTSIWPGCEVWVFRLFIMDIQIDGYTQPNYSQWLANWKDLMLTFFTKYEVYQLLSKYLFLSVRKIVSIKVRVYFHIYWDWDYFYQLKSRLTWSTVVWYYLYQLRLENICINWDSNLFVSIDIFDNWMFLSIEVQDYNFFVDWRSRLGINWGVRLYLCQSRYITNQDLKLITNQDLKLTLSVEIHYIFFISATLRWAGNFYFYL